MMFPCKQCGLEFARAEKMAANYVYFCRACINLRARQKRAADPKVRERDTAKSRAYRAANPAKARAIAQRYFLKAIADPAKHERQLIRARFRWAVRSGKIKKQPCEKCGAIQVEAHHSDYANTYDVMWLCNAHHKELHRKPLPHLTAQDRGDT